jgi:hypothetical protein
LENFAKGGERGLIKGLNYLKKTEVRKTSVISYFYLSD